MAVSSSWIAQISQIVNEKQWLPNAIVEALQPTPDRAYEVADGKPGELGTGLRVRLEQTGTKGFNTGNRRSRLSVWRPPSPNISTIG